VLVGLDCLIFVGEILLLNLWKFWQKLCQKSCQNHAKNHARSIIGVFIEESEENPLKKTVILEHT
jgi:hypothetical protein